jgi:ABC-type phosphate transport system substrate-binding protein
MRTFPRRLPVLVAALAALCAPEVEAAECSSLGFKHPVYVTGSSAAKGLLSAVAKSLAGATEPVNIVYVSAGSCAGVTAVLGAQTPLTALSTDANPPTYWDAGGNELKCDLSTPVQVHVGISDVFAETCIDLPNGYGAVTDNLGPVQAMTFVVPNSSPEKSISAEAAYMIFGFGKDSGVTPWTDEASLFVRSSTSGTLQMLASAIGVPGTKWKGVAEANSGAVVSAINAANGAGGTAAAKAIGILSADLADANRLTMRELAYKHYGQNCGWLPDSSAVKFDKANVRNGHYAIWGPIHLLRRTDVDAANQPYVKLAIDYVTGAQDPPGVDLIAFEAAARVIPQCAMRVQRKAEMGPLSPFTPVKPCGCYYEYSANAGTSSCKPCSTPADCDSGTTCTKFSGVGYCEPT